MPKLSLPMHLSNHLQGYLSERSPGAAVSSFQFLTSGFESDIYTFTLQLPEGNLKDLILRLFSGKAATEKLAREAYGLRLLYRAGYPVPELILCEPDSRFLGKPFIILEKLAGRALWPLLAEAAPAQASVLLEQFGGLIVRLHQLDWRPFTGQARTYETNPKTILVELCASLRQLYTRFEVVGFLPIVDWLERCQADITVQPAVVHLDFHANNVLLCKGEHKVEKDRMAVIDWTQIAVSDYRADLSWTLMIMGDYGAPQWKEQILHAYQKAARHPVINLDYFNVIAYTKLLASTIISLKTNPEELGMRPETAKSIQKQAPTLLRLSRRIQDITGLSVPEVKTALVSSGIATW